MADHIEKCPHCGSANVIFSKKKQTNICEDCEHEIEMSSRFQKLTIFISYGRDEYAILAERLKADLEKRGHEVWFDKEKLKDGGDWEQYIEDGLNKVSKNPESGRIIFIMTPHSVRRPDGYCLNEIAKALTRSVPIIPIMLVYSEPPLSIYRLQYLDMQDCFPPEEKVVSYEKRFERLVLALEAKKTDFEGSQSRMLKVLEPIHFAADIAKLLKDFTGRKWVFDEIDTWLKDPKGSKIFWIMGDPGTGKSAIAAWIRENRREIAAFHFCDYASEEKRDPARLVCSIAYQISTQLPAYEERLKGLSLESIIQKYHEANTLFDILIVQPLSENFPTPDRTIVVLIDALDEATYKNKNEITQFLARCSDKTPTWLRFLITSRPEPEVKAPLQSLSPYILDTSSDANTSDMKVYLRKRIPTITDTQIQILLRKSEGVFLYLRYVCDEIESQRMDLTHLEKFPQGLGEVYHQFFERQFGKNLAYYRNDIRPLLCLISAAYEPLELDYLMNLMGYKNKMELFDCLDCLGSLFPRTGDRKSDTIAAFHRSVSEWIINKDKSGPYFIDVQFGHQLLMESAWKKYTDSIEKMDRYSLEWLPGHLSEAREYDKFIHLLKDFNYLMVMVKEGMLERLLSDYRELVSKTPSEIQRQLRIEEAFFRERAHILRRGDNDWPSYKILFQLAIEHADNSPLTKGAEQYLEEGKVGWICLRRKQRLKKAGINLCHTVLEGHTNWVNGALLLADGRILSWSEDKTMRIWDSNGRPLAVLVGHKHKVDGAIQLTNGQILSWSKDGTLYMWDMNGQLLKVLDGHSQSVDGAIQLTNGQILSWSKDVTLHMWDMNGQLLKVLDGHSESVDGVIQLANGQILSWSKDGTLHMWDMNGQLLKVLDGHSESVCGAIQLANGQILSWSKDSTLRIWDTYGNTIAVLDAHTKRVGGAVEFNNGRILSWSWDHTLCLWGADGRFLAIFDEHSDRIKGALQLNDDLIVSWAHHEHTLRIWNTAGTPTSILKGHKYNVNGALQLKDGHIVSWSEDNTLRIWDTDGRTIAVLEGHGALVYGALPLNDGQILSWSKDKTLRIWDTNSCTIAALDGHKHNSNRTIHQNDSEIRYPLTLLDGHKGSVNGAIQLNDGRILSWSEDTTLRIWDKNGYPVTVLEGHNHSVEGAKQLNNGQIESWEFQPYYNFGGIQLERITENRFWDIDSHPISSIDESDNKVDNTIYLTDEATCFSSFFTNHEGCYGDINLPIKEKKNMLCARWHGDSDCKARFLRPDGSLILTQTNGQVCFLELFNGKNRISLNELLSHYGYSPG